MCIFKKTITCPITVLLLFFGRQRRMFSKRLSPFTTNHLSQEVGSHKGYTLVGIPGQFYHQQIENTFKKVRIILNIKYRIYPRIGRTFFPEKWDRNWGCGLYAGTRTRPQQFFFSHENH